MCNQGTLRLMVVSCEAKKKQPMRPYYELFTRSTALKFLNAVAKPPYKLLLSYSIPRMFLLCTTNKPTIGLYDIMMLQWSHDIKCHDNWYRRIFSETQMSISWHYFQYQTNAPLVLIYKYEDDSLCSLFLCLPHYYNQLYGYCNIY